MRRRESLLRKQFALPAGLVERTVAKPTRTRRGGKP